MLYPVSGIFQMLYPVSGIFQMLYSVSGIYSSDTFQFWDQHRCFKYNCHCIQCEKIAQTL